MPALHFLGRKWLVADDDLVIPFSIEVIFRLAWLICASVIVLLKIKDCQENALLNYFLYATMVDLFITSYLSIGISVISSKGSALEVEKRKSLPTFLYLRLIMLIGDFCVASFGIWLFTQMESTCIRKEIFINITTVLAWIYIFIAAAAMFICYNSLGSSKYWNVARNADSVNFFKEAEHIWKLRLKFFCCCADISEGNDFIYVEISRFLASFLNGIDLVPTDILAGVITLSEKHALERRKPKLRQQLELRSDELLSSRAAASWMTPENALYFLRIAKSTYGWIAFFNAFHPWRLCSLLSDIRCCVNCCSQGNEYKNDGCFYCNSAAVKKISGFTDEDILYSSFRNYIHEPAFYVAVSHEKKSVIIAIRGSSSFSDIVTNIDGKNLVFPTENGQSEYKGHRGVLQSAFFVQKKISELNILNIAFTENPSYTLVLTGHSLGGSIAAVLGLLIRPNYPTLQCYSYAPLPALSASGIPETLDFVYTVIVGDDIVPRLCASACRELRREMIKSLDETKVPKYKILTRACWYHINKYLKLQTQRILTEVHDNKLCEENDGHEVSANTLPQPSETNGKSTFYVPGRILYFENMNEFKTFHLTGLNIQKIMVSTHMLSDHQPHTIESMLKKQIETVVVTLDASTHL